MQRGNIVGHLLKCCHRGWTIATGFWNNLFNQQTFLDTLAKKLDITSPEGWYNIRNSTLRQHNGSILLERYQNSMSKMLIKLYPEYQQACRNSVLQLVQDLKLSSVEDLLTIPYKYLWNLESS